MTALQRIRQAHRRRPGFVNDERGLSTVEYVIILMLIAVVGIGVWGEFGSAVEGKVDDAIEDINTLGQ
jgi:Flp pilus assembly pilin Flp